MLRTILACTVIGTSSSAIGQTAPMTTGTAFIFNDQTQTITKAAGFTPVSAHDLDTNGRGMATSSVSFGYFFGAP